LAEISIGENYGKFKSLDIVSVYHSIPWQRKTLSLGETQKGEDMC